MELTATLFAYIKNEAGNLTTLRERSTFDPHMNDLDGLDATPLTIEQKCSDLDHRMRRLDHIGAFWYISHGDTVVAHSSGYRRPIHTLTESRT